MPMGFSDSIRVCVRKRPVLRTDGDDCVLANQSDSKIEIVQERLQLDGISKVMENQSFYYDHVFDEACDNQTVLFFILL